MKKFRDLRQEVAKYDYGTPESVKYMKKVTPGQNENVKSVDRKPEKYVGPDGKARIRMVPVDKDVVKNEQMLPTTAQKRMNRALKKHGVGKNDDYYLSKLSPEKRKKYEPQKFERKPVAPKISTPPEKRFNWLKREMTEGSESWEAGYKRRVVKTTKPEHKEKGYNWRIKGKDRPEVTIKLYKEKPSQAEFNKQMKRVAGHEFG